MPLARPSSRSTRDRENKPQGPPTHSNSRGRSGKTHARRPDGQVKISGRKVSRSRMIYEPPPFSRPSDSL